MSASDPDRRWAALVASGRASWRVGLPLLASDSVVGGGVVVGFYDGQPQVRDSRGWVGVSAAGYLVPDFADPYWLGWLLALVRLAWGDDAAYVAIDGQVECLLAALEAALKGAE